jgi:hypothetical protein
METQTKILPRGHRTKTLLNRKLSVDTVDVSNLLIKLETDTFLSGNKDIEQAAMHLDLALRRIKKYNQLVIECTV